MLAHCSILLVTLANNINQSTNNLYSLVERINVSSQEHNTMTPARHSGKMSVHAPLFWRYDENIAHRVQHVSFTGARLAKIIILLKKIM